MADGPSESLGLRDAIIASSERLGISPSDLATVISYETAGTMDPWKKGPTTQWGEHRGLIQWGEPQRKKYGVTADMPVADQMRAVEAYLMDAGVKPGHGLLDVYSAVNAGRVGLYNRSDANNGGAPGTVADKVASMAGHRMRANAMLGVDAPATVAAAPSAPAAVAGPLGSPLALVPPAADSAPAALGVLPGVAQAAAEQPPAPAASPIPQINFPKAMTVPPMHAPDQVPAARPTMPHMPAIKYATPAGLARMRALAQAMSNSRLG